MGLFGFGKREQLDSPVGAGNPIEAFWRWWAANSDALAAAVPRGELPNYAQTISGLVHAIDTGLAWEFGPGTTSEHQLTVTAAGNAELRRVARRWLRAAPPADAIWAFNDLRQPSSLDVVLQMGPAELSLADVRVATRRRGAGLDVVTYHPLFAELPEEVRGQITFLCLDNALGEEAVDLWVEAIDHDVEEPPGSRPLADLPELVAEVIVEGMPGGEMGWTVLSGDGPEGPVLVSCLSRLSSVQAPDCDQHVGAMVEFADVTAEGFPGEGSFGALGAFEDQLVAAAGDRGRLVAVETAAGRRTLHFYVDSASEAAARLEAAAHGWQQGLVTVNTRLDPAWQVVSQFRM